MAKKLPFILIVSIIASILLNPIIPLVAKQIIFAISTTIKSIVLFSLPFIIFGLLFKTFVKLSEHALSVVILIFGCLCMSNFFNTFVTHYVASLFYYFDFNVGAPIEITNPLVPYFSFEIPKIIKNEYALFGGIIAGVSAAIINKNFALQMAEKVNFYISKLFAVISFMIPLFIIGFVIKCASEGILTSIIKSYAQILFIFVIYASIYTFVAYFLVSGSLKNCINCLKNMMPALLGAFSTVSSALTMPITILCTEKNVKNKELAGSTISATVNIHLLGDCLSIPLLAYALLKHYGMPEPSLASYFVFTIFFVIAKFSVAAVPAGGIIVMVPILEKYLGFTSEMSSLIIAIYAIFDPFVTSFNVLGNGAFAKLIDNLNARTKYHI